MNSIILDNIMNRIESATGLYLPPERRPDVERAVISISGDSGYHDAESFSEKISERGLTVAEIEKFASELTVGETYFFREPDSLRAFEYTMLPELLKSGNNTDRRLRIWSTGCASGEEPYTIAMILKKNIPCIEDWNITILATDININFIKKATAGIYTGWSFRNVPRIITDRYFTKNKNGNYVLNDEIKRMVSFSFINMRDDSYPSVLNNTNSMDVIFCRNMLMYFTPDMISSVIRKLHSSLNEGGYLIVGQTELSGTVFRDFETVRCENAVVYRRNAQVLNRETVPEKPSNAVKNRFTGNIAVSDAVRILHAQSVKPQAVEIEVIKENAYGREEIKKLYDEGSYAAALEALKKLKESSRNGGELTAMMAGIYANMGMLAEAEYYCRQALSIDDLNPVYYFLLASIYKETGSYDDTVTMLRKAVYLDSEFIMAYYNLGIAALRAGSYSDAVRNFTTALSLLEKINADETVPESGGIPAGRLTEIINSIKPGVINV